MMQSDGSSNSAPSTVDAINVGLRVLLMPPTSRDGEAIADVLRRSGIDCVVCPNVTALCAEFDRGAGALLISEEAVTQQGDMLAACVSAQSVWSDLPILVLSRSGIESPRLTAVLSALGNVSVVERPIRITTLLSLIRSALRARKRQYEVALHLTEIADAQALLRESEIRFRVMADSIPNLAWITRPDGHIYWYNRRWYEYTGTTPEEMEGWGWQDVHDPAELPKVLERWRTSIETGQAFEMEFPLRGADGDFRMFLTRIVPLRNEAGAITQWFGTNTDVTDQQRAAEERERLLNSERIARSEAERASRIKDEFLATLSHELRTPLNAILGWSQIIRKGDCDPDEVAEGVEVIERNARVQTQIIEDLLDMSRIISGKMRLDVQRIDLADVVRAAAETVGTAANAKEIRMHLVLDPRAGKVSGDPNRLQQVFWNLLSNAIKFTAKGGRVQVLLERVNSHLEVSIIDTGEGIESEFLPHVFDRFRQADGASTRRHGGLGLGLAIVKQLVELHGGTIRAKSPGKGQGSTFVVSLPVITIHPEVESSPLRVHPTAESIAIPNDSCVQIAGIRVLVVDDEPDARALLRRLLEDCDATVTVAASAEQAFSLLKAEKPDVLISDIGMPDEDGYKLIRRVRALSAAEGGDIPAIALTAYARSEDRVQSVLAGFQHHVSKPVEPAELIAIVASLVRQVGKPA